MFHFIAKKNRSKTILVLDLKARVLKHRKITKSVYFSWVNHMQMLNFFCHDAHVSYFVNSISLNFVNELMNRRVESANVNFKFGHFCNLKQKTSLLFVEVFTQATQFVI